MSAKRSVRGLTAFVLTAGLVGTPAMAMAAPADTPATPKNIILMISDGAGYNQFDAANFYETGAGYNQVTVDPATDEVTRVPGTAHQVYESWPVQVAQSNFSASGRGSYVTEQAWEGFDWVYPGATDSAAASTALGTGVKTRNGILGYDPQGDKLLTVSEQAKAVGKKAGVVTSVPFNHATPAGMVAHNQSRNDYQGLATEMINSGVDVIMGGGHPNYDDNGRTRVADYTWISSSDFGSLVSGGTDFSYIETKADFEALAATDQVPEKVFGLAQVSQTLQYNRTGVQDVTSQAYAYPQVSNVPDLATMTNGALNVLETDEDGFFLMVEGGAVDWAGHANYTGRLVEEQQDFNRAVEAVSDWVEQNSSWDETLVMVTADHETGYLSGPGADPGWTPMSGEVGKNPEVSWHSGNHTNTVVPFFAKGAGSDRLLAVADEYDLVRGAYLDNTEIGEAMFDFLGHSDEVGDGQVAIEADVPVVGATSGALSMTVAPSETIVLSNEHTGMLPEVTVTDTRSEVQSLGKGWNVVGAADDFVAGNRTMDVSTMSWAPAIVSSDAGASAGATASFGEPLTLASADRVSRTGTTIVDAELSLEVPAGQDAGRYGTEITLSLFAQD